MKHVNKITFNRRSTNGTPVLVKINYVYYIGIVVYLFEPNPYNSFTGTIPTPILSYVNQRISIFTNFFIDQNRWRTHREPDKRVTMLLATVAFVTHVTQMPDLWAIHSTGYLETEWSLFNNS